MLSAICQVSVPSKSTKVPPTITLATRWIMPFFPLGTTKENTTEKTSGGPASAGIGIEPPKSKLCPSFGRQKGTGSRLIFCSCSGGVSAVLELGGEAGTGRRGRLSLLTAGGYAPIN